MPVFEIEQYEVHAMTYRVNADNCAEAIIRLMDGEAEPVEGSLEYIEVAEDLGLSADDDPELAQELRSHGLPVHHVIPSIRSITQIDPLIQKEDCT